MLKFVLGMSSLCLGAAQVDTAAMMAGLHCYSLTDEKSCTAGNCTFKGYCGRSPTATQCTTTSSGCDGCDTKNGCTCGDYPTNMQTCSHCADSCPVQLNATACHGISQCTWNGYCLPPTSAVAVPCRLSLNKTACLKESAGCFWMNATEVLCGKAIPLAMCTPCNDQAFGSIRSPLSHQPLGQTCTWAPVAPFTHEAQVTLTDFASAATGVGGCTAMDAAKPTDGATLGKFLSTMGSISASATGSCGGASVPAASATTPPATTPVMTQLSGKAAKKNAKKGKKGKKAKASGGN